ncbi:alpha/beta hydrolase-fold protein [Aquabacterium sp. A7-Y]|uniref:alpha/beta hydrolase n=1 Tax=Aquabacterium sp. A7-Y TaxID=1349605 RepID=UPI00223DB41E|nr:alpha/beta hydrolase-fold protein [Aquabacterium sp. A7-Y]MCW7536826.1 alpha/beta hydrolase-fold protein [Aquabacterium sp. A7-Y]
MHSLSSLAESPAVSLPRTHQIDRVLAGRPRRLFVALPDGPVPRQGHPVLWTLDGNTVFPLLAALLRQRSARPADLRGPLPVVVGLGYPGEAAYDQRARADDYTLPGTAGASSAAGGQADRFLDLLEQLRPWLAQQMPIDPARHTLFGHSFGGLLTLYALFSRPTLFQRHLAASPSIWWGDRVVLRHCDAFVRRPPAPPAKGGRLVVTAGSLEEGQSHADPERQRRQQVRRQVSSARELVANLGDVPGWHVEFRLLDGEDHGSLVLPSAALALDLAVEEAATHGQDASDGGAPRSNMSSVLKRSGDS